VVGETSKININLPGELQNKVDMKILGLSQSVFASPQDPPIIVNKNNSGYEITALKPGKVDISLKLLGYIPIRSMQVEALPTIRVVPGGHSIGVLMQSRGVMVVGYAPILDSQGQKRYPARENGVQIGDIIMKVNGKTVSSENDLARIIDKQVDKDITLMVKRGNDNLSISVRGIHCSETGRQRIGLYVRDGVVGVGTLTFWEPETKKYAALGHIITDADTKQGIDILNGHIVSASIQSVKPAKPGKPGEKIGVFQREGDIKGNIKKNGYFGIYGLTENKVDNPLTEYTMEIGYAHQVKEGKAQIYTVVNEEDIEKFDIIIEKVFPQRESGKGMVIRVTDQRLLNLTGGIIQGMSGSPIIQDNRIVGAVTHVFLNNPERGYGIFMDNMLSELEEEDLVS